MVETYSMTPDIVVLWIRIFDAFKMRILHRLRDKHFNADGLSKRTEFYQSHEKYDKIRPVVTPGLEFLDQSYYDQLEVVTWPD